MDNNGEHCPNLQECQYHIVARGAPYECHQIADGPACCQWLRGGGSPQEANQVDTGLKVTLESATNVFNGATDEGDDAVLVSRLLPTESGAFEAGQRLTVIR